MILLRNTLSYYPTSSSESESEDEAPKSTPIGANLTGYNRPVMSAGPTIEPPRIIRPNVTTIVNNDSSDEESDNNQNQSTSSSEDESRGKHIRKQHYSGTFFYNF